MSSVFEAFRDDIYKYKYAGQIKVDTLVGGTPSDPKKIEGWLRTKLGETKDDQIRELTAKTMIERGLEKEDALEEVMNLQHLNGFKRTPEGQLYVEGRQLKAAIKEAANIRWPKERWGPSKKGTRSFFAEHVFVAETILPIFDAEGNPVLKPTDINQRFVHTFRGSGIQYEEFVDGAIVNFTVETDYAFDLAELAHLWVTAEQNGFGASRSQGFGRFEVAKWETIPVAGKQNGKRKVPALV